MARSIPGRTAGRLGLAVMAVVAAAAPALTVGAAPAAAQTAPATMTFDRTSITVFAGTTVSLNWGAPFLYSGPALCSYSYVLTSTGPDAYPDLASGTDVTWPTVDGASAAYDGTDQSWVDTLTCSPPTGAKTSEEQAVAVAVPSGAAPGTVYSFQLKTCDPSSGACSGSTSDVSLTVAGDNWADPSYTSAYRKLKQAPQASGDPLDVTFFGSTGGLADSSEFSDAVGRLGNNQSKVGLHVDKFDTANQPFASSLFTGGVWKPSGYSYLGEQVVYADGMVWSTQGGADFFNCPNGTQSTCPSNDSEILAYDPSTNKICTYQVAQDDAEVYGIASTGTGADQEIWFTQTGSAGAAVDHFAPADVPGPACDGSADESYVLTTGSGGDEGVLSLPGQAIPAEIAVDPDGTDLWVSGFWSNDVMEIDTTTDTVATTVSWTNENPDSAFGSLPWQVAADAGYVYVINYGSDTLVQIDKATGQANQIQIPVTSSDEQGYGLALSGSDLYFTLSDDSRTNFASDSTFGYVDVGTWEAEASQCASLGDCAPTGAVYTGVDDAVDPPPAGYGPQSDIRGIAVDSSGTVALADTGAITEGCTGDNCSVVDNRQVLRLKP